MHSEEHSEQGCALRAGQRLQGLCLALSGAGLSHRDKGQFQCGMLLEVIHRDSPHFDQETGLASAVSAASCSKARACGNVLCLGQSSSSLFPAGSVDFGPDVTSSDKSIKVLLNSQDKVSPQKPRGSPLGRRQSGPFPPLSLSRSGWGLLGPQSMGSGTDQRNLVQLPF